jgi:hypothetical protein
LTRSGEVVVWILEVPKSVFKGGKLDEKSLKSWLKEVHEEAYKQFTGGVARLIGMKKKLNSALSCLSV